MKKPEDDLKLDINEIFGGDWTEGVKAPSEPPLPSPPPSVLPESLDESASDIKFNDEAGAPVPEPVVITVISKTHRSMASSSTDSEIPVDLDSGGQTTEVPSKPAGLVIRQPGTSGKGIGALTAGEGSSIVMKPGVSARKEPSAEDLVGAYDRFRLILLEELKSTIDVKKISMMLVKTFEAARESHPEIFRNANWDASGNLIEDGSLNVRKVIENRDVLDPKQADVILDNALLFLFNLRMQAVEKALGPEYGGRIKNQVRQWIAAEVPKNGFGKNDPRVLQHLGNFLL